MSEQDKTGGPAFPVADVAKTQCYGLTLRDYFAAKAMQGMCAQDDGVNIKYMSGVAYEIADAMLAARAA